MIDSLPKTRREILKHTRKPSLSIVRDYDKYEVCHYSGLMIFATAVILSIILSYKNQLELAGIIVISGSVLGAILFLFSLRCPICDRLRWYRRVKYNFFESEKLYCEKCLLTKNQMSRYVDMLKRNVEINEDTVRKIFFEK